jgi:hypothetical protein
MPGPHRPDSAQGQASPFRLLSRRTLLPAMIGSLAGASLWLGSGGRAAAQPKTAKKVAKYQDHPNQGKSCSMCRYFHPPDSCQLVAGKISPTGWCSFFAQKS